MEIKTSHNNVSGGVGVHGGTSVLRVREGLGVVEPRAHAATVRAARAPAGRRRRVRLHDGSPRHAAPDGLRRSRLAHQERQRAGPAADSPGEPQRQGGRSQAKVVRLGRLRGRSSSGQEALVRSRPPRCVSPTCSRRADAGSRPRGFRWIDDLYER